MKEMKTKNLFDFLDETKEVPTRMPVEVPKEKPTETPTEIPNQNPMDPLPEPRVCPCRVVNGFTCPSKMKGRVFEYCIGTAFAHCPNYSAWWHYKRAEVEAKMKKRR